MLKFYEKISLLISSLLFFLLEYLSFKPVPVNPVAWKSTHFLGYEGVFHENQKLANLKLIPLKNEEAPEHIYLARDGMLYNTVLSGNILRMTPDGENQEVFVNTGGRVLGFDFDAEGNLIASDSIKGSLPKPP